MMPRSRLRAFPLFVLLLGLLPVSRAAAHQQLLGSSPEAGAVLSVAPTELRLTFNQAVEPALASLSLLGPHGEIPLAPLVVTDAEPKVLSALIEGALIAGDYAVSWLVTGDDGHAVRGEVRFTIAAGAAGLAAVDSAAPAGESGAVAGEPSADPAPTEGVSSTRAESAQEFSSGSPFYGAVRWLTFAGIIIVTGAVAFALLLVPGVVRRGGATPTLAGLERARARAAAVGLAAAAVLLVAAALRLLAQGAALGATADGGGDGLLVAMLTRTMWGWGWLLQVGALLLLVPALAQARRGERIGWALASVAAVALAVTPALSGHAVATSALAVVADSLHVLAAGGWLGTLLVMLLAGAPVLLANPESRMRNAGALLSAFSPLALGFAALVVLTGIYAAAAHLPDFPALFGSAYGQTLLIKLALLLVVFGIGAYNWLRARPALERSGDAAPLRRSAAAELAAGALVLAATAALVATPPPTDEAAAAARAAPATASQSGPEFSAIPEAASGIAPYPAVAPASASDATTEER